MKKIVSLIVYLSLATVLTTNPILAEETVGEKISTAGSKAVDGVKKTWRNAKDEVCEMVNGKANCVVKKVVNKIKSSADKIETTAEEAKNKAD